MFLTSLELTADINERRLALNRAREHGLNVHRVAVVTAERTIDRAFEVGEPCTSRNSCAKHHLQLLPQMKGPLPSVIALQASPSDIELLLLRSIEWTTFEDGTYDTALEQATVILRYFLGRLLSRLYCHSLSLIRGFRCREGFTCQEPCGDASA
jgi:nuclear pore complex protein Nup107